LPRETNKRGRETARETRLPEVSQDAAGREANRLPVAGQDTPGMLPKSPASVTVAADGGNCPAKAGDPGNGTLYVPVVDRNGKPLMPCRPERARELVKKGRAVRRFSRGVFYIRLTDRAGGTTQPTACGVDPGSKREAYTVKSSKRTFLNVQADAVDWVKSAVKTRREMRRGRRFRKTPCRANRRNRARGGIPPSTRARWAWKLRICRWLSGLYPISVFVVEDIKARTKGERRWDSSFSPLEVGKRWFYGELGNISPVRTRSGWETKQMREALGLEKIGSKLAEDFRAHCVDSWVLAASEVGGTKPDNTRLLCITPVRLHRRQLHRLQPAKGGVRHPYGGTRSLGFKRGSTVKHPKYGVCYVGGTMGDRISLHSFVDGRRLCQNAKPSECKFLAYSSWRTRLLQGLKSWVSAA
jgi:hypothetical protein